MNFVIVLTILALTLLSFLSVFWNIQKDYDSENNKGDKDDSDI